MMVPLIPEWTNARDIKFISMIMMVMLLRCYCIINVGYDKKRSAWFCNASINRKYDNYSCHRETASHINTSFVLTNVRT